MVDQDGRRFCDESGAYMEIGQRLYARHEKTGRGIPAWVILDSRHRDNYPWGTAQPGKTPQSWLDSGYMKKADTLEELARLCGIDAAGLEAEVSEIQRATAARASIRNSTEADARSIARTATPPSSRTRTSARSSRARSTRCAMYPGDVGTAGGIVTDEHARVLREDGSVIEGLYATGQFDRVGRGSVLSRRRRQHRRVVRVRISRRAARGARRQRQHATREEAAA